MTQGSQRLKRGQLAINQVQITKAELDRAPEAERIHFIMLAQTANELAMLRVLIIQALQGAKGPLPKREAGLGMAFMLARLLAGRVHEAWGLASKASVFEQFTANALALPDDARADFTAEVATASAAVASYFAQPDPLIARVRKKLAFHHDRSSVVGAYNLTPDDFPLIDFHTGTRGSTFYGAADSLAAFAASHLMGSADPVAGQSQLIADAPRIGGEIETIIDGYVVTFCAKYLGLERFRSNPTVMTVPTGSEAKAVFFLDDRSMRRERDAKGK